MFVANLLASFVFALGLFVARCAGQPVVAQKVSITLPFNFTLAALNTTLPNANSTGVPLVLGQNGASQGVSFHVTSTYASYPFNDFPTLALVRTALRAFFPDGEWITNATTVHSGETLDWVTSRLLSLPSAKGYTAVQGPGDEFAELAAFGVTNLWSLCPFTGFRGQTNVVFNVTADIPAPPGLGFDPADCYDVKLNIIPV